MLREHMRQFQAEVGFEDSPLALLYDRYAPIILMYIARYISSREDADDLLLDVFVAALENQVWLTWSEGEQLAWLRRIAYNKAIDYYRRSARHPSVALEQIIVTHFSDDERSPEQVALRNEAHAVLRAHLSNLSDLQQEIVRLRFGHGLRTKEIAQRLNKSDEVIRVTLSRALNLLRKLYRRQEGV
ncbi:DNA-directed RNA polymerase sigma-70 factor [Ktedonobacter sp. SOSP1-85]|uniref:RNA polymerase sigma factor n=1 Tax=Ktedonobacter sp. SOSP1-85 TaxID=2778367 RepID=UPI001A2698CA|nr:RNA polymerase sigma factor [Ktedonobacter sp. SOSP1-85]GHO79038.1 DNA-directed RNA polymerase sigma-70 factor [Ktedonobacter sp. SOSP1-85]